MPRRQVIRDLRKGSWGQEISWNGTTVGSGPTLAASLDGTGHLSEMQHAKICFRMPKRIPGKRACNGFWAGHSKVVYVIGIGRVWKIGINHASCEVSAIVGNSIKMISIRQRIKFRDQFAVLLGGRVYDENVDAANHGGRNHFSPLRLVARRARRALTICSQVFRPVSLL